ncbi:hypothetical protein T01_12216 [Trichinella spiralis]|uniref:Uncharacterized protein n=1 Tax=Trichinella spiralis TaxID=6334 RepID=A0A0V1B6A8_TRISP|nr:hypothetical protein T01_12216 [Trichinella spiralis]
MVDVFLSKERKRYMPIRLSCYEIRPTANSFVPSIKPPPEAFKGCGTEGVIVPSGTKACAGSDWPMLVALPASFPFLSSGSILLSRGHCTVQALLLAHSSWRHGIRLRVPAFSCLRPLTSTSVSAGIVIFSSTVGTSELTIRLVSHGSFQHGFGFSGIQHPVESYHSFSTSQGAQGEVEDASMPADEASRRKNVTAEQESICISSGLFSTVPVITKSHTAGISGLNIYISGRYHKPLVGAHLGSGYACMRRISCFNQIGPLRLCPAMRRIVRSAHVPAASLSPATAAALPQLRSRLTVGRPSIWCAYAGSTHIVQGTSRVDAYPDALSTRCFCLLGFLSFDVGDFEIRQPTSHQLFEYCLLPYISNKLVTDDCIILDGNEPR